jgi:ATP10 protein
MSTLLLRWSAVVAPVAKCLHPRQTLYSSVWVLAPAGFPNQKRLASPATYIVTRSFFDFPQKQDNRIRDIIPNPDSIGSRIKPGNLIDKFYKRANRMRTVPVELAHGYFWMIKDVRDTQGKPTLSNTHLIPTETAQQFPSLLSGVKTLSGESVEIPEYFSRQNRK